MTPQQQAKLAQLRRELCDAKGDVSANDPATHAAVKAAEAALKAFEQLLAGEQQSTGAGAEQTPPKKEPHDAIRFMRLLAPIGPWCVRTISSIEGGVPQRPSKLGYHNIGPETADDIENGILGWIAAADAGKHNAYTHGGIGSDTKNKQSEADVYATRVAWAECDPGDGVRDAADFHDRRDKILAAMRAVEPALSVIVDSGNGYQAWYHVEPYRITGDEQRQAVRAANRGLAAQINGLLAGTGMECDKVHSADHLMRLPGTTNFMTEKKRNKGYPEGDRPARIIDWHPERLYRLEDLPALVEEYDYGDDAGAGFENMGDAELTAETLGRLLSCLDVTAFCDYDRWVRLMMACHHGTGGSSAARDVFVSWCVTDDHYARDAKGIGRRWDKHKPKPNGITVATLYKEVMDAGGKETLGNEAHGKERPADGEAASAGSDGANRNDVSLDKMNAVHFVTPMGGKTRVVTLGADDEFPGRQTIVMASTFEDFKNLHSNRTKVVLDGKGKPHKIGLGEWWLDQEKRRQYTAGMKFMPRHDEDEVGGRYNKWRGFAVESRKPEGMSGAAGCQLFLDHGLKVICGGNEEHFDYLMKREATIVQRRIRTEIAVALRTEAEGTGKGMWVNGIGRLYGQHYMEVGNPEHVIGKHNDHLESLLKLGADEALFAGDPRHRNVLFGLITEPTITVEPKFIGSYAAPNFLNVDIISNHKHFIPVSGTARRFFVPTVSADRVGDLEYFGAIEAQLLNGGHEALLYHLQHEVDIRDFDVRRVPKTAGLREQASYTRKGIDGLVEKACSEAIVPCRHHRWSDLSFVTSENDHVGFDDFISKHPDRAVRDLGSLKAKNILRNEWHCKTGDDGRRTVGRDVVRGVVWPDLEDLRNDFEAKYGPQDWLAPHATGWLSDKILTVAEATTQANGPMRTVDERDWPF